MTVNLLVVVLPVFISAATSTVIKTGINERESGANVEDIFAELKAIKQNFQQLNRSLNDINNDITGRVDNVTLQLSSVRENITEHLKDFENKTSPMSVPFLPMTMKNSRKIQICPARHCLHHLTVRNEIVDSVKTLDSVSNATSIAECAAVCFSNTKCAGIRLGSSSGKCLLLSYLHPHIELRYKIRKKKKKTEMTKLLVKKSGKLGYCSYKYRLIRWEQSRYYLPYQRLTWKKAQQQCHRYGGKLAELTSWDEIKRLGKYRGFKGYYFIVFHVGAVQVSRSTEPDKGWHWTPSNITIPSHGFVWKKRKPDNAVGDENVLGAQFYRGRIRFIAYAGNNSRHRYLCECLDFGRREYRYRLEP